MSTNLLFASLSISTWVLIGIAGLVLLFFLLMGGMTILILVTCVCEKQYTQWFAPRPSGEKPPPNPYHTAMNQMAERAGFINCGDYFVHQKPLMSKLHITLWLSPDHKTLALVCGGKVASALNRRTLFLSRLTDKTTLETRDEFGTGDLSGTRPTILLIRADFNELAAIHSVRVQNAGDSVIPFSPANVAAQYHEAEAYRAEQIIALGLGRYVNKERTIWKYNFKGARKITFAQQRQQMEIGKEQMSRLDRPRPGD